MSAPRRKVYLRKGSNVPCDHVCGVTNAQKSSCQGTACRHVLTFLRPGRILECFRGSVAHFGIETTLITHTLDLDKVVKVNWGTNKG